MNEKQQIKEQQEIRVGSEVIVDGIKWAIVEEITQGGFLVVDQDGGEMEVYASRVDLV